MKDQLLTDFNKPRWEGINKEILNTPNGDVAKMSLDSGKYEMGFRGTGREVEGEIEIDEIFTWDVIEKPTEDYHQIIIKFK